MENDIKVTVWCLAYNHEKYIRQTLEGFVKQKTDFNFEVIVHEDASTDGTADIIREYAEKYPAIIKPIFQTENQYSKKIGIAQHFLLPVMKGKYIAYCEGDDFWCDTNKLQMQYDIMEADNELFLCTNKVLCVNEDSSPTGKFIPAVNYNISGSRKLTDKEYARLLFNENGTYPFQTCSYFCRSWLYDSEVFKNFNGIFFGDKKILKTALLEGKVYYIDKIMSCWRCNSENSWHQRYSQQSVNEQINHYLKEIESNELLDKKTDFRYHDQISICVYGIYISLSSKYGTKAVKPYFENLFKKYRFNYRYSMKFTLKYIFIKLFPFLFDSLYSMKRS